MILENLEIAVKMKYLIVIALFVAIWMFSVDNCKSENVSDKNNSVTINNNYSKIDLLTVDFAPNIDSSITVPDYTNESIDTVYLTEYINNAMANNHWPSLQFCVLKNGEVVWSGAYGYADIDENIPMSDTTVCLLASTSKTTVGIALMQLWQSGNLLLDADINDYFDFTIVHPYHPEIIITPRMLMSHTASTVENSTIPNYTWGADSPISLGYFCENYFEVGGAYYSNGNFGSSAPGGALVYSSTGIALAAHLVEVISAKSFEQYCQDSIFAPLGMNECSFFLANLNADNLAVPYYWDNGEYVGFPQWNHPMYPAGFLRTSALQLGNYLSAIMEHGEFGGYRLLESETVDSITTVQYPQYSQPPWPARWGMVWWNINWNGRNLWGHEGLTLGFRTLMYFCPEENTGVIIIRNGQRPASGDASLTLFSNPFFDFVGEQEDLDEDGIYSYADNCPEHYNPEQEDDDNDGVGNLCDKCAAFDDQIDADFDSIPDNCDNCISIFNPNQYDYDEDGIGDTCDYICGDANRDSNTDIGDAVYIINNVFKGGPPSYLKEECDANCDGECNIGDAVYIINHVFKGGPGPGENC